MSNKSEHVTRRIEQFRGQSLPAHYLAYFDCFNHQLFYEAHDVLEALWLPVRRESDGAFYKGLIQLAGAFVHVQKNRPGPAMALLRLARANLETYPEIHHQLELSNVLALIEQWQRRLEGATTSSDILSKETPPRLALARPELQPQSCGLNRN